MSDKTNILAAALQKIARWRGEFPSTGRTWADGSPMSYSACYGSNGERDYMRQVALDALAAADAQTAEPVSGEQIAWNVWSDCHYVVRQSTDITQATWSLTLQREQIVTRAQSKAGAQTHPPVIQTEPDVLAEQFKRAIAGPQPPTEQPGLSDALDLYEAQTEALPLGHEIRGRGYSAYNWQMAVIREIRALLKERP